jgi:hypothetical protein
MPDQELALYDYDRSLTGLFAPEDEALRATREEMAREAIPRSALDSTADSGIARFNAAVAAHPQLLAIIVPVLRGRGIDGLLVAVKQ